MKIKIPNSLKRLTSQFKKNNFECYLVGGAIRNILLKQKVKDYDIATNALPQEVNSLFKRVIPTGLKHGTVTVLFGKEQFEVTTFRIDGQYSNGRRPDSIKYSSSIQEDLRRRDFTINAIAYNLIENKLMDPFSGIEDLKNCVIRAIGDPLLRFKEDALRILRACRFSTQLNFTIEEKTLEAMSRCRLLIKQISHERIRDELIKILESPLPSKGIEILRDTDLLKLILPELQKCVGVKQPSLHRYDVYFHSIYSCDAAPQNNLDIRIASLLHDIGKPLHFAYNNNGEPCFYNHEQTSSKLAKKILKRLKFTNTTIKKVSHLILHHMFNYDESWSDAAVRRFIKRVGFDNIFDLFALRRADQIGMGFNTNVSKSLNTFIEHIEKIKDNNDAYSVKDIKINGHDIMKELSITPGVLVGKILSYLLECVLEDPKLNERKKLLKIAKEFYKQRLKF